MVFKDSQPIVLQNKLLLLHKWAPKVVDIKVIKDHHLVIATKLYIPVSLLDCKCSEGQMESLLLLLLFNFL